MNQVRAPWTDDQVASLNGYQSSGMFHPFTGRERPDGRRSLVAKTSGWEEPDEPGVVVQDWAWDFMTGWGWSPSGASR